MSTTLASNPQVERALAKLADSNSEIAVGESRQAFPGFTWETYLTLDSKLGHDRQNPRLFYLDGTVEIVSSSALEASLLLPDAPLRALEECAQIEDWTDAILRFRELLGVN